MILCSAFDTPTTNYDIFGTPLGCPPFMQTIILQALLPILSPVLEAHEETV